MPGYSATTLAGLLLAVLSILSTTKVGTAMMVLAIPWWMPVMWSAEEFFPASRRFPETGAIYTINCWSWGGGGGESPSSTG